MTETAYSFCSGCGWIILGEHTEVAPKKNGSQLVIANGVAHEILSGKKLIRATLHKPLPKTAPKPILMTPSVEEKQYE